MTNAPNFIRGYDPRTGKESWRLGRSSKITAPTPVFDRDLIVVMSGRRPNAPIFVLKAGAKGDITLPERATTGGHVVWTRERSGSYMPTPVIYRGHLYVLKNEGILACYDLASGEQRYETGSRRWAADSPPRRWRRTGSSICPERTAMCSSMRAGPQFELDRPQPMGQP